MNIVIIEDESRAAKRIERLLKEIKPDVKILATLESVAESLTFLQNNQPDLILSDIQLADGLSFEIYKNLPPTCPIIFTTAYDNYAIEAFETNGVDYLLKPIEAERLAQALDKTEQLKQKLDFAALFNQHAKRESSPNFKKRFMIKVGDKIKAIPTTEISVFYSLDKGTFLHTVENRNYVVEYSLEQLNEMLDPTLYFRVNRKYIVHIEAPGSIIAHTNSRLKLVIPGFEEESIIVAREKVGAFKQWLDQ